MACAMAVGVLAPLAHAEDLKHKQKHVHGQIKSAHKDFDESSARLRKDTALLERARTQLASAQGELTAVRAQLAAARLRDAAMATKLDAAVQRLADARSDLVAGQRAMEDQRLQVTDTITSIYEQGDPELLAFASLLDAQSPADLTRRMEARNVIVGRETRAYDDLHAAEVLLQVRETGVQAARDDVAAQRRSAAAHLVVVQQLHQDAKNAKIKVRGLVDTRRSARQQAIKTRKHDRAVLAKLRKQENRIRQQILRAQRRAHGGYRGRTNGLLNMPVNGPMTSPYGYRMHPIYHYWGLHDGDDFGASCGQSLIAVADGTVMSEYYSSVWGNRLYLNLGQINGKNVTVIYNHLSSYVARTGQKVGRGDIVGRAGTTGWSTGCHLHFTVLVNGSPVNPTPWL